MKSASRTRHQDYPTDWHPPNGLSFRHQTIRNLVADHDHQLEQVADLLTRLKPEQFVESIAPDDSIGAHIRHLLEHYLQLFLSLKPAWRPPGQ